MLLDKKGIKFPIQAVITMHKPFVHEKISDIKVQILDIKNSRYLYLNTNNICRYNFLFFLLIKVLHIKWLYIRLTKLCSTKHVLPQSILDWTMLSMKLPKHPFTVMCTVTLWEEHAVCSISWMYPIRESFLYSTLSTPFYRTQLFYLPILLRLTGHVVQHSSWLLSSIKIQI